MLENSSTCFLASDAIIDFLMVKFETYLYDKQLKLRELPYTAEQGIQISVEPSMMYYFNPDKKGFYIDTSFEKDELAPNPLDHFCLDKYQGIDKSFKRPPKKEQSLNFLGTKRKKSMRKSPQKKRQSGAFSLS